jgi:hypothetical protein
VVAIGAAGGVWRRGVTSTGGDERMRCRRERRGLWRRGDGDRTGRGGMRSLTLVGGAGHFLSGTVGPNREIRAVDAVRSRTSFVKKR